MSYILPYLVDTLFPASAVVPIAQPLDSLYPASAVVPTTWPLDTLYPASAVVPTARPLDTPYPASAVVSIARPVDTCFWCGSYWRALILCPHSTFLTSFSLQLGHATNKVGPGFLSTSPAWSSRRKVMLQIRYTDCTHLKLWYNDTYACIAYYCCIQ